MSQKLPKQKKPGFSDNLYVLTDILCKNPVSKPPSSAHGLGMGRRERVLGSFWGETPSLFWDRKVDHSFWYGKVDRSFVMERPIAFLGWKGRSLFLRIARSIDIESTFP